MKRIERYLGAEEQVVYASRQHPVVLAKPLLIWLISVGALAFAGAFASSRTDNAVVNQAIALLVSIVTIYAVFKVLVWWAAQYAITDHRVMLITGLLSVKVSATPLSKINDTIFVRSIWGRLLGYGNLVMESAGERAGLRDLQFLPKPNAVYRLLTSLVAEVDEKRGEGPRPQAWPGARDLGGDETGTLPRMG
ncbi:MAG: PH domain-containing protein [Actinomycetota bacterium]